MSSRSSPAVISTARERSQTGLVVNAAAGSLGAGDPAAGGGGVALDRRPHPCRHRQVPCDRGGAGAVPRGSLLPLQRHSDPYPALAPAAVRHPAAVPPFPGKSAQRHGDRDHQGHAGSHGVVRSLRLAGQRPRTGEHHPPRGGDRRRQDDLGRTPAPYMRDLRASAKCHDNLPGFSLKQAQEAMEEKLTHHRSPARDRRQPPPGLETAGDQLTIAAGEDQKVWD